MTALVENEFLHGDTRYLKGRGLRSVLVGMFAVGTAVITGELLAGPMSASASLIELVISRIPPEVRDVSPNLNAEVTLLALLLAFVLGGGVGLIAARSLKVGILALCALGIISGIVQSPRLVDQLHVGDPSISISLLSTAAGVLVLYISHRSFVPRPFHGPLATPALFQDTLATLKITEKGKDFFPIPDAVKNERHRYVWSKGYHSGYDLGLHKGHEEGMSAGYDAALSREASREQAIKRQPSRYAVGYRKGKHSFGYEIGLVMGHRSAHSEGRSEEARQKGYREGYAVARYNLGQAAGLKEGRQAGFAAGRGEGYPKGYFAGNAKGSREGYSKGWDKGYRSGQRAGHRKGYDERYPEGHRVGYDKGVPAGRDDGRRDGYQEGHKQGYNVGHKENYAQSHTESRQKGYRKGFSQGLYKGQKERQSET